ncbi:hypothetical protein Ancab_027978 [Ancistrocladus abbreviatus]
MATNRMKKSEAVHHLWELTNSKEAIIYLLDSLFVYLSGEEKMEDTLNKASTQYLIKSKALAQRVPSKKEIFAFILTQAKKLNLLA